MAENREGESDKRFRPLAFSYSGLWMYSTHFTTE